MNRLEIFKAFFLLGSGILAGSEILMYFCIRKSLSNMEQTAHIALRKDLILTLRVFTPIVFLVSLCSGVAAAAVTQRVPSRDLYFLLFSNCCLALFILVALFGTVPINKEVLLWDVVSPPDNWKVRIANWEKLDLFRCLLAMAAFVGVIFSVL